MIGKIINIILSICVLTAMSFLLILIFAIAGGLLKDKVLKPLYDRYIVQPLYVDDPRCCR